jgi:hypothetical protein
MCDYTCLLTYWWTFRPSVNFCLLQYCSAHSCTRLLIHLYKSFRVSLSCVSSRWKGVHNFKFTKFCQMVFQHVQFTFPFNWTVLNAGLEEIPFPLSGEKTIRKYFSESLDSLNPTLISFLSSPPPLSFYSKGLSYVAQIGLETDPQGSQPPSLELGLQTTPTFQFRTIEYIK